MVSGNVSGIWTTNQSPYILSADCTVVSNQTLIIQPGVEVIIGPNIFLNVFGGILAVGTPEQPITIRGASSTNYWRSFLFQDSYFTNRFHYCRISDSHQAFEFHVFGGNGVTSAEFLNCDFSNCLDAAIVGGASGAVTGTATFSCNVNNCSFDGIGYGCIFYSGNDPPPGDAYLNARVAGNIFKNLRLTALYVYGGTNAAQPLFINNTVSGANKGVEVSTAAFDTVIENNLFIRTSNAVVRSADGSSSLATRNNCFFNNTANFVGYPFGYGLLVQNNHNGDPCDAFFNIFLDPRLLDTNRFLLSNVSPCIDAGDPAIADVCFDFSHRTAISDIGAYGGPDACGWLTHGFAPVITTAPHDQTSCVGAGATFKVNVEGVEPLAYRWYFNGTNLLAGETNAQLNLLNLQTNQAGLYSVTVSNTFGTVASAPARLLVFDACVGVHLYAGLSVTGVVGRTYSVEYVTNLAANNWAPVASNTLSQPYWLFIDTNTPFNPQKFFRARLLP